MDLKELAQKAREIKEAYAELNKKKGQKAWGAAEYTQGFVGDVGDLVKLMMARGGFRHCENVDHEIAHELADCLWSVLVIADELGVDLEPEFVNSMEELKKKIASKK